MWTDDDPTDTGLTLEDALRIIEGGADAGGHPVSPESQRIDRARASWGHALRAVQEQPKCKFAQSVLAEADKAYSAAWADFHKAKDATNRNRRSK